MARTINCLVARGRVEPVNAVIFALVLGTVGMAILLLFVNGIDGAALAVHRKDEYAKADILMLPVIHGGHYTVIHILLYTIIFLAMSLLRFVIGMLN